MWEIFQEYLFMVINLTFDIWWPLGGVGTDGETNRDIQLPTDVREFGMQKRSKSTFDRYLQVSTMLPSYK